jgi:hypothetical protein
MRLAFSSLPPELIREATQILGQIIGSHLTRRSFVPPPLADCMPLV